MFSMRFLALLACGFFGLTLASGAFAEINPADMVSGCQVGPATVYPNCLTGQVTLFNVPTGRQFVLTDLTWTPLMGIILDTYWQATLGLRESGTVRYLWTAGQVEMCACDSMLHQYGCVTWADHEWPVQEHWSTGLVFASGSAVELAVTTVSPDPATCILPMSFDPYCPGWSVSWSGYLASTTAGLGDSGPELGTAPRLAASPNPSGSVATIEFTLPESERVVVAIFDVSGHKIRTLHKGILPAGTYSMPWDGRNERGAEVADGVYLARLETKQGSHVTKVTRVR